MSESFADDFLKEFVELVLPQQIADRFDAIERLAQNEYGETYLLSDKNDGKRYVLKCYKKSSTIDFAHEAEILRGLEHKGLPTFDTEIEDENTLFILREYVDGVTLEEYLTEYQPDETQTVGIAMELCDVLSYLHSQPAPIIHRDIKPTNIIINPRDNGITLIDFGISRTYSEDEDNDTSHFGTHMFAPPEQYGFSQTDGRADLFALGVVLRYMLTGSANDKTKINDKALRRIVAKCCAFSPASRYQSAAALKKAIAGYQNRTKQKIFISAAAVFAVCLVFVAGFAIGRYTEIFSIQLNDHNKTVVFTEPLIEKAVRLSLGKDDDQPVLRGELKYIRELYIIGEEAAASNSGWNTLFSAFWAENLPYGTLKSLNDLSMMENLERLNIVAEPLSDLSPLAKNTRLSRILITHCNVSDASPLADLPRLKDLTLFDNQLDNFSDFDAMKSLSTLDIGSSTLNSFSELGNMTGLRSLRVLRTKISKLDGIESFSSLEALSVAGTAIHDFSALNNAPNLKTLYISEDMEEYLPTLMRADIEVIIEE